ncbi:MAG: tyrosine-type recombinase/integrase [Bdellovibrio sp.]|nr:tyrosine-type recombinase/integrase [Bdellovibrio sp.]
MPVSQINNLEIVPGKNLEDLAIIGSWLFQKSEKTQRYYRRIVKEFMNFYPALTLKTTQITHLSLFIKTFGDHTDSTRNTYKNALCSLFSFAQKTGYIERNPATMLESIKTPDRLYSKVLSREQVEQMILKEMNSRNSLILKIFYFTGIRVDELCKLKVTSIQKTSEDAYYLLVEGKGRKVRSINLPSHLSIELLDYVAKISTRYLFVSESDLANIVDKPLNSSQIFRIVRASAVKAKLSVMPSPHWLRHTCATHSIEAGAPIHVVQKTLGHESISTTGKYLDIRPKESAGDYLKKIE